MKQFQYIKPSGAVFGPYDIDTARGMCYPLGDWLDEAGVGFSAKDGSNDVWTRLPDLEIPPMQTFSTLTMSEPGAPIDVGVQAERLERIATAVLGNLIGATLDSPEIARAMNDHAKAAAATVEALVARDAIGYAKALIAELDKQS